MDGFMAQQHLVRMDPRLLQRLAEQHATLAAQRPLPPAALQRIHAELQLQLTFHSTGLEGNTLSLRETQLVIEYGMTIGGHSLREHLEATNHAEAMQVLYTLSADGAPVTAAILCQLHALVMDKLLEPAEVGQFRTGPVSIRGARWQPPAASQVPAQIAAWRAWLIGAGQRYEPITRAAIAHHDLLTIHPFRDGNGRTARLLLNLLLLQAGYPPALLLREWRHGYLDALAAADSGRYNPLITLIGRAIERGFELYLDAIATVDPHDDLLPLAVLATESPYSAEYLALLVRKGRLPARKQQGRWYSTRAAVARYQQEVAAGGMPRGRPPRSHEG
jgi:Fic family protein